MRPLARAFREGLTPLLFVSRGWGELLYLDAELRIQRDLRGDIVIATKVD